MVVYSVAGVLPDPISSMVAPHSVAYRVHLVGLAIVEKKSKVAHYSSAHL